MSEWHGVGYVRIYSEVMGVLFLLFAVGLYIRFFYFPGVAFLQYLCSCAIGIQITKVPGGRIFLRVSFGDMPPICL